MSTQPCSEGKPQNFIKTILKLFRFFSDNFIIQSMKDFIGMFNMENFKYYKIVQGKKSRFIKFSSLIFCHFCSFDSGKFHREIMLVENFK